MPWTEHLGGNKYKLVARDPTKIKRPKRSKTVEVPPDIAKNERRTELWLALELAKWTDTVEQGQASSPDKISFADFVPVWKKGYADQKMGEYTRMVNLANINTHLIPEFGDTRIDRITTLHLVTYFASITRKDGKPMATNTKLNVYKAAKSIFDAAYDWKVIANNPMEGVERPSQSKKEKKEIRSRKQAYNRSEIQPLLNALYDLPTHWRLYFTGVMMGGFRRGEMLAVEWTDVDYERGAIWIETQITLDEKGNKIESEVKTEESEGWVAMPQWYMDELKLYEREWRKEKMQCIDWEGGDKQYIFHGGKGVMYFPSTPTGTWRKFLKRKGLPHVKLHGLRHTAGMILRESGVELKAIQERLRHTKLATTADIYLHESDEISREASDHLETFNPREITKTTQTAP